MLTLKNLFTQSPSPAMLPTKLALALLEVFSQFPQPFGIVKDVSDSLLPTVGRFAT